MKRSSVIWFALPVITGIAVAAWFVARAPEPPRVAVAPPGMAVNVTRLRTQSVRPVARGWGNIQAAETWTSVAEVRGQIIWRHPDLETGRLIPSGTKVLEIDPSDYELATAQAKADLAALNSEAAQVRAEADNTAKLLELEQARLVLSERDLTRIRSLAAQGATPQARVDEAERAVLLARRSVTELRNATALIAPRLDRIAAQAERTQAALARAQRDLEHTAIRTPFDLRVTSVPTERFQYVNTGQTLATGNGIARVEAVAQVPLAAFRRLFRGAGPIEDVVAAIALGPADRISAEVRPVSDPAQVWTARVTRIEGALDPRARTVPVVVTVADPYTAAKPPLRPPLVPNMQVEVRLVGSPLAEVIVVPETALHGDLAYLADADDRLELRRVTEAFRQEGQAVIADGLKPGDRLVLDIVAPALPGMALQPIEVKP